MAKNKAIKSKNFIAPIEKVYQSIIGIKINDQITGGEKVLYSLRWNDKSIALGDSLSIKEDKKENEDDKQTVSAHIRVKLTNDDYLTPRQFKIYNLKTKDEGSISVDELIEIIKKIGFDEVVFDNLEYLKSLKI